MSRVNKFTRSPLIDQPIRDNGPYEAVVVSHFDRMSMGTLEVELLKYTKSNGTPERTGQLVTVRYLSPFYGVTPFKGLNENDGYENTQKSYGFWAVPPDPGTRVLVIFAEGNPAFGYWIGCIQDPGMNFMVPDGRASTVRTTDITPEILSNKKLPVGEYNKKNETGEEKDPTLFRKPYNKDFTNVLQVQGLLNDEARGTTTSSARRETPSMVFGISTPGPLDRRQNSPTYKYGAVDDNADYPFNRLGGSSIVMDDGDDKFIRATHAEDGPPVYLNREKDETGGDETIPQNELIRFRTRTGHQILLHNSEDLIYIANSRGTAWIEMTSDGKIDIHAQDSISVMSDTDINFTAERDFNVDVGRNINMRASARWSDFKELEDGAESGRVQIEAKHNMNFDSEKATKISTKDLNINNKVDFKLFVDGNFHLYTTGHIFQQSKESTHFTTGKSFYHHVKKNYHVDIEENSYFTTFKDQHRKAGYSTVFNENTITNKPLGAAIYDEANGEIHIRAFPKCGDPWQPDYYYLKDFTVTYDNKCWRALEEHRSSTFDQSKWEVTGTGPGTIYISAAKDIHTNAGDTIFEKAGTDIHEKAGNTIYEQAGTHINNLAGSRAYYQSGGNMSLKSGGILAGDAPEIHWNSGIAASASSATDALEAIPAVLSVTATKPIMSRRMGEESGTPGGHDINSVRRLERYTLPYVIPGVEQPIPYESILLRAPQHEPWPHHENLNPLSFKKGETDREQPGQVATADRILTPDTFLKNKSGLQSSIRVGGSGGNIDVNTNPANADYDGTDYNQPDGSDTRFGGRYDGDGSGPQGQDEKVPPFDSTASYNEKGTSSGKITYANQNKTRNLKLEPKMENLLSQTAEEIGVDVVITSGGQVPRSECRRQSGSDNYLNGEKVRTGSLRHDYGSAADIDLYNNGDIVRGDTPLFLSFVQAFFRNGVRGGGCSPGYMGANRMHLDIVGSDRGGGLVWKSTAAFKAALRKGLSEQTSPIRSDYADRF